MKIAVSAIAGVLFAIGLCLSGMTQPTKVVGFLDLFGDWDPSLALVMVGAIGSHVFFARRAMRSTAPLLEPRFYWPERTRVDVPLVVGSAIFGIGWGLAGYCPGPAIVSLARGGQAAFAFVVSMLIGIALQKYAQKRMYSASPVASPEPVVQVDG